MHACNSEKVLTPLRVGHGFFTVLIDAERTLEHLNGLHPRVAVRLVHVHFTHGSCDSQKKAPPQRLSYFWQSYWNNSCRARRLSQCPLR